MAFFKDAIMREITTRRLKEYKKWRKEIIERDRKKCTKCDSEKRLHAHHIIGWDEAPGLRVDMSNGITLCQSCHQKLHATGHKGSAEATKKRLESRKGYRHSEETKKKLRLNAGRPKGIPMTEETKAKISAFNKGKKLTPEHIAKIKANGGRPKGSKSKKEY